MKNTIAAFAIFCLSFILWVNGLDSRIFVLLIIISIGILALQTRVNKIKLRPGRVWHDGRGWRYSVLDEKMREYIQPVILGLEDHAIILQEKLCADPDDKNLFI